MLKAARKCGDWLDHPECGNPLADGSTSKSGEDLWLLASARYPESLCGPERPGVIDERIQRTEGRRPMLVVEGSRWKRSSREC